MRPAPGRAAQTGLAILFMALSLRLVPIGVWLLAPQGLPWLPAEWVEAALVLGLSLIFLAGWPTPLHELGLRLDQRWARQFGLGALGGVGLIGTMALVLVLTGDCTFGLDPTATVSRFLTGTWLYLAVAANEELLFRGYGFQQLATGATSWVAQVVFAALFAAVHLANPGITGETRVWAMADIGIAGLLLGQAYLRTRSLALPMGLHFGWNWAQGTLLGIPVSGTAPEGLLTATLRPGPVWRTGGAFGLEATLACALVAGAAYLVLVLLPRRPSEEAP